MEDSFTLRDWLIEPHRNSITGLGEPVKIEPRAMQVLVYLARHAGETVSREDVLDHVWEGTIVAEEALTSAIRKLRKALGDDAKNPEYIQTVPGQGYRLNVEVSWQSAETHKTARLALLAAAALLIALLAFALYRWAADTTEPIVPTAQPLTGLPGLEYDPAISPDRSRIAFARHGLTESAIFRLSLHEGEPELLASVEGSVLDSRLASRGFRIGLHPRARESRTKGHVEARLRSTGVQQGGHLAL